MISDSEYQDWIDYKRGHESPHGFTHGVMNQVRQYDQSRRRPFRHFADTIRSVSTRWPTKLAVAASVVGIGLIRIVLSLYLSLK
jgi:hypothetical protein